MEDLDRLFDAAKYEEVQASCQSMISSGSKTADICWRLARAQKNIADAVKDQDKKKKLTHEALASAQCAYDLDKDNAQCNKWLAILTDMAARLEGTKARIEKSYVMRDYLMRAKELDPDDAGILHSLGVWCFEVTDVPWLQRKAASVIFAKPPNSTYEEALEHCLEAEKKNPLFYNSNLLYIGKCYLRLKKYDEAKKYLQMTLDYTVKYPADEEAKAEAAKLIKDCK